MSRLTGRAMTSVIEAAATEWAVKPGERQRYARDPFAHLDEGAVEEWVDDFGDERVGHVFVPDLITLEDVPFAPWAHQRELLQAWIDLEYLTETGKLRFFNVHDEKSRQMGGSWILAYACWWALAYHPFRGGYSNYNAFEVDDGGDAASTDSFFGRIKYINERVPPRFQAPLRYKGGSAPRINRERGTAFLVGKGAVMNPGRGGRYDAWIIDEAARFPYGETANAALNRACPNGRLFISTPEGEGNIFFRLRDERPATFRFRRHHWSTHPVYAVGAHIAALAPEPGEARGTIAKQSKEMRIISRECPLCVATMEGLRWTPQTPVAHRYPGKLTSPWYDEAVTELTDEQVAAELDIDYQASLTARVYPGFSTQIHVVDEIPYDPAQEGYELAIDYGLDCTAVAIFQNFPDSLRQIGELEIADATPDDVSVALIETLRRLGIPSRLLQRQWTSQILAVGDPAGEGRSLSTGKPLTAEYRRNGWSIVSRHDPVARTIIATRRLLLGRPKPYRISEATCPLTIKHWKLNRWPTDRAGNRKAGATVPLDDEHNHMMRAIAYYATFKFPPPSAADAVKDATRPKGPRSDRGVGNVRRGERY